METKELESTQNCCGLAHSKIFQPSVISPFLEERDEDGNLLKVHSDVHLILHQQDLVKHIGVEQLRRYLESMVVPHSDSGSSDELTDDEIFGLIEPKEINNITTAYEFAKYLESNSQQFKQRYEDRKKALEKQSLIDRYFAKYSTDKPD